MRTPGTTAITTEMQDTRVVATRNRWVLRTAVNRHGGTEDTFRRDRDLIHVRYFPSGLLAHAQHSTQGWRDIDPDLMNKGEPREELLRWLRAPRIPPEGMVIESGQDTAELLFAHGTVVVEKRSGIAWQFRGVWHPTMPVRDAAIEYPVTVVHVPANPFVD